MKNAVLVVLAVLAVVGFVSCGDKGVTPTPPNTGPWNITFYPSYTDGSSTDGIKLQVSVDDSVITTVPVHQDSVVVLELERNIEYHFSFQNPEGETIILKLGDQERDFFSLSLLDGEEFSELQVPSFSLMAKIVPTVLVLNITPISSEAEVWVDGDSLGSANANGYFETTIDPGNHEIKLIGWDCQEKTVSITIAPCETKSQDISLEIWDLSGEWKQESNDKIREVGLFEWHGESYWGPWGALGGFRVKGNRVSYADHYGSGTYAEGEITENGKRIKVTLYIEVMTGQYEIFHYVYTKV